MPIVTSVVSVPRLLLHGRLIAFVSVHCYKIVFMLFLFLQGVARLLRHAHEASLQLHDEGHLGRCAFLGIFLSIVFSTFVNIDAVSFHGALPSLQS